MRKWYALWYIYIYIKIKTKKRSALERNVECLSFRLDAGVLKFAAAKLYPSVKAAVCKASTHTWDSWGLYKLCCNGKALATGGIMLTKLALICH